MNQTLAELYLDRDKILNDLDELAEYITRLSKDYERNRHEINGCEIEEEMLCVDLEMVEEDIDRLKRNRGIK